MIWSARFAYEYEDFVFSIFTPYASKIGNKWTCVLVELPRDVIISRIEEDKKFQGKDAEEILKLLVEKEIIDEYPSSKYKEGTLTEKKDWTYKLGATLDEYANVISEEDLNIDKWIEQNGQHNK